MFFCFSLYFSDIRKLCFVRFICPLHYLHVCYEFVRIHLFRSNVKDSFDCYLCFFSVKNAFRYYNSNKCYWLHSIVKRHFVRHDGKPLNKSERFSKKKKKQKRNTTVLFVFSSLLHRNGLEFWIEVQMYMYKKCNSRKTMYFLQILAV